MQGCPVWGGDPTPFRGCPPPHEDLSPPSPKFWVLPHGDIGPLPQSEISGALRAHLVIIILSFQLEANVGYIVILFNGFV